MRIICSPLGTSKLIKTVSHESWLNIWIVLTIS
jgi:hypothetical protein